MLGVIASLLFVGYQIKLSRDIAMAEVFLGSTKLDVAVLQSTYTAEMLRPVLVKMFAKEPLSQQERTLVMEWGDTWMTLKLNAYYQFTLGLISEERWVSERNYIANIMSFPCYSEWWVRNQEQTNQTFVAAIADIVAAAPKDENCGFRELIKSPLKAQAAKLAATTGA
jgi:hypothetical protein